MIYFTTLLRILSLPLTLAFTWFMGRRDAKLKAAIRAAREYQETMERMQNADTPMDASAASEWLRDRGKR